MPNYHRTYQDLARITKDLPLLIANDRSFDSDKNVFMFLWENEASREITRFIFGCTFFEITVAEGLEVYQSNRYFIDALDVKIIPTPDGFEKFFLDIQEKHSISEEKLKNIFENVLKDNIHINSSMDLESLDRNGFLVIENVLDSVLCDQLYDLTLEISNYEKFVLKTGYTYGSGKLDRVYTLISKHKKYQELVLHPLVHRIMSYMFHRETFHEKYYLTSFHANILQPGAEKQIWHIDANVPEPIPPWIIRSNSNFILQDYTSENGATEIIAGSHRWCRKPNPAEATQTFPNAQQMVAPKGSVVIWHGHLWHRSAPNRTTKPRVALLGAYAASFLREVCMEENPFLNLDINQIQLLPEGVKSILGWNHGSKNYYF